MDPFGRPLTNTAGDAALAADTAQAALAERRGGFSPAYGGRRYVGDVRRGGLLGSPAALYGVPGIVVGFLLALFLNSPTGPPSGGAPPGGGAQSAKPAARKARNVAANWAGTAPPPGTEVKLMLVVREDLGMSVGKTAAQCAHAAVGIVQKLLGKRDGLLAAWEACGQPKICVKCSGIDEMLALAKKAEAANLPLYVVQDAGRTEVAAGTSTVLAIGPGALEAVNAVTGDLKLLR